MSAVERLMNEVRVRDWHRYLSAGRLVWCLGPALLGLVTAAVFLVLVLIEPRLAVDVWVPFAAVLFVTAYVNAVRALERQREQQRHRR